MDDADNPMARLTAMMRDTPAEVAAWGGFMAPIYDPWADQEPDTQRWPNVGRWLFPRWTAAERVTWGLRRRLKGAWQHLRHDRCDAGRDEDW